ncbi:MAG: MBL fold metallo-hydrolase [Actinomycetota bacterium]|nr:MBL fold metallo-hydrolase [Actinomycetota bacterium]
MTEITVRYVGGPTALLEIGPWRLLTDPTFDPAGGRYFFGWGTASRKLQAPAIAFEALEPVHAVLLSHDHHGDNLDPAGRALLPRMGTVITTVPGARRLGGADRAGGDVRGLDPGQSTVLTAEARAPLQITATPCRHGPPGSAPIVGAVIGFDLGWEGQRHGTLWISGDTVLFDGLRAAVREMRVSVAVLHLGGVTFPWLSGRLRYTMNAAEAIDLCRELQPETILPLHFEGWRHFREPRDEAVMQLAASPFSARVRWPAAGEAMTLEV